MASGKIHNVFIGTDFEFEIPRLRDLNDNYLNAATITSTVLDEAEAPLAVPITPTVTYTAASNGVYTSILTAANTEALTENAVYVWQFTINGGTNRVRVLRRMLRAIKEYV